MIPVAVTASVVLIWMARSGSTRLVAAIFVLSVLTMFVTSAVFHRNWMADEPWRIMRQIDQTAIYLVIAGTFTGLVGVSAQDDVRLFRLVLVWLPTAAGIALRWSPFELPRGMQSSLFVVLGVVAFTNLQVVVDDASAAAGWLVFVGGVLYVIGVLVLGLRRPDPWPRTFGYHEIWHVLVVVAVTLHYLAVAEVVA